jgi:predicted enzyme related to lactoylglutathione lyase
MAEQQRDRSPFAHIVIPAPELERAGAFYETVFGWKVQRNVPGQGYWFFESGNVSGAFDRSLEPARRSTLLILRVPAMERTLTAIVEHGGSIARGRERIGNADPGYDARFLDPNGNELGLYSAD